MNQTPLFATRHMTFLRPVLSCLLLLLTLAVAGPAFSQDTQGAEAAEPVDMAAMMERARQFTTPGEHHELLQRFLGTWDTETRVTMVGVDAPAEKGVATFSWLIEGRWLQQRAEGTLFGQPATSFSIMGYDNFKQSYVTTAVSSVDTVMTTSEGDLDPGGKVLITYGTLDEYLSGEHDKMVKYVWRFHSDDRMTMEIHDLPIGEKNTQVIEMTFTRRKDHG